MLVCLSHHHSSYYSASTLLSSWELIRMPLLAWANSFSKEQLIRNINLWLRPSFLRRIWHSKKLLFSLRHIYAPAEPSSSSMSVIAVLCFFAEKGHTKEEEIRRRNGITYNQKIKKFHPERQSQICSGFHASSVSRLIIYPLHEHWQVLLNLQLRRNGVEMKIIPTTIWADGNNCLGSSFFGGSVSTFSLSQ